MGLSIDSVGKEGCLVHLMLAVLNTRALASPIRDSLVSLAPRQPSISRSAERIRKIVGRDKVESGVRPERLRFDAGRCVDPELLAAILCSRASEAAFVGRLRKRHPCLRSLITAYGSHFFGYQQATFCWP